MAEDFSPAISSVDEIIEDARNGKMYILVDAEDRENEGDLIIPASFATPEAVNFMAKFGRGLICLAMTGERGRALNLDMMARENRESMGTAFTVAIEAKEGVTTGISAHDRSHTVQVAIDPMCDAGDIVSPGHVFPLIARDGGTLVPLRPLLDFVGQASGHEISVLKIDVEGAEEMVLGPLLDAADGYDLNQIGIFGKLLNDRLCNLAAGSNDDGARTHKIFSQILGRYVACQ